MEGTVTGGSVRQTLLLALLLVLAAILPELPALRGEFQWDDEPHISQNANLHDVHGLARTWIDPTSNIQYYPLSITAFWIEYQCFGLENLAGYHFVNMLLHAGNVLLVWLVLRRLRIDWAWLAAMVFAVHPIIVESVAYISELKNLLSGGFFLLATLGWLRWNNSESSGRRGGYVLCVLAFIAAMLAKSTACTFPVVMLLVEWWRHGRVTRRKWVELLPLFFVALAFGVCFAVVERMHVGANGEAFAFNPLDRILIASHAICFYVLKMLWPAHLLVLYPRWPLGGMTLYPFCVAAGLVALWMLRRTWGRGPFVAAVVFVVLLSPALGFISYYPMLFTFVADHYAYLAVVPFAVLVLGVVRWVMIGLRWNSRWMEMGLAVVLAAVLAPVTFVQAARWQTKISLWEPAAVAQPDFWYVTANLANGYVEHEQFAEAREWAEHSLAGNPANPRAWFTLGRALLGQGDAAGAVKAYQRGLSGEPTNPAALYNLAVALQQTGDLTRAEQAWRDVVGRDAGNAKAWNNLATLLLRRSAWQEGADAAARAIAVAPSYGLAHVNRGLALEKLHRFAEAAAELKSGLSLVPENAGVRLELARDLAVADDPFAALAEYRRIIDEAPELPGARAEYEALMRQTSAPATSKSVSQNP